MTRTFVTPALTLTIFICIAGTSYVLLWPHAPYAAADTPGYVQVAADFQDGKLDELHSRTIGYPLLLSSGAFIATDFCTVYYTALSLFSVGFFVGSISL